MRKSRTNDRRNSLFDGCDGETGVSNASVQESLMGMLERMHRPNANVKAEKLTSQSSVIRCVPFAGRALSTIMYFVCTGILVLSGCAGSVRIQQLN